MQISQQEETEEYCLVVVGNKTDIAPSSTGSVGTVVSEEAALDPNSRHVVGSTSFTQATPRMSETGYLVRKDLTTSPADPTVTTMLLRTMMGP